MRDKRDVRISLVSVIASVGTFIFAHLIFGKDYVIKYFLTIFLISLIPLWPVFYIFLRRVYKHFFDNCIKMIFNISEEYDAEEKVFGINTRNIIIELIVACIIMISYIYFGENNIIIFPATLNKRVFAYALGVVPIVFGSFAGSIMISAMIEATKFIESPIKQSCYKNYVFMLLRLKDFLNFSVFCAYIFCGSMYLAVILGPCTEGLEQPVILFLVFLALWPLIIHFFSSLYVKLVKEKILVEKFKVEKNLEIENLKEEIERVDSLKSIFSNHKINLQDYSIVLSAIISVVQVIVALNT